MNQDQQSLPLEIEKKEELKIDLYCDGASRGNPGPSSAGAVIYRRGETKRLATAAKALGKATNNRAEYNGLLLGLTKAREVGATHVNIFADSQLMIKQINGEYKIKDPGLRELANQAKSLLRGFTRWNAEHIPRERNKEADALANKALDEAGA